MYLIFRPFEIEFDLLFQHTVIHYFKYATNIWTTCQKLQRILCGTSHFTPIVNTKSSITTHIVHGICL